VQQISTRKKASTNKSGRHFFVSGLIFQQEFSISSFLRLRLLFICSYAVAKFKLPARSKGVPSQMSLYQKKPIDVGAATTWQRCTWGSGYVIYTDTNRNPFYLLQYILYISDRIAKTNSRNNAHSKNQRRVWMYWKVRFGSQDFVLWADTSMSEGTDE